MMMKSAGNIYTVTLLCTQATVAAYDICKLIGVKHNFQTGDKLGDGIRRCAQIALIP